MMPDPQPESAKAEPPSPKPFVDRRSWGRLLADLRHQRGISQRQLAILTDMPRTFISKLERRDRPPTYVSVVRISSALQIESNLLLDQGTMRSHLLHGHLLADPFLQEVWQAARGLKADELRIIEAAVKTLSEGQLPLTDWMRVEISGSRPVGA